MRSAGTPAGRIPVDARIIFADHNNVHTPVIEKRQRALLKKVAFICDFLEPRERVLLVAPCVSGYVNRALLVVTSKGIFPIPTKLDLSFRHSIGRLRYGDCKRLDVRPWGLAVEYANGRKERFLGLRRTDRLKLKTYLQDVAAGRDARADAGKSQLCPRCTRPLAPAVYLCPGCRLPFKDMATAMRASLLIPGGGYFYTGHPVLGVADMIAQLGLLALVLTEIAGAIDGQAGAVGSAVVFGIALAIEKLLTVQHVKRCISEFIPKPKTLQPRQVVPA